ncbi:hypothetical protein J6590_016435 [Homalodisca vitripennis]|nr:hypothetical protein J6590_016435 [Homalodisca vitripennis]
MGNKFEPPVRRASRMLGLIYGSAVAPSGTSGPIKSPAEEHSDCSPPVHPEPGGAWESQRGGRPGFTRAHLTVRVAQASRLTKSQDRRKHRGSKVKQASIVGETWKPGGDSQVGRVWEKEPGAAP